ncbi:MAG: thioredoxin family protein [Melioribacteraceae bacterium]
MKQFFKDKIPHNGFTYREYQNRFEEKVNSDSSSLEGEELEKYNYTKLNLQRTSRVHKTYKVSEELKTVLSKINKPQLWMVLTESWCGDSAQNLPYIAMISEASDKIDLRILERDANLEIMDQYLTNGISRSVPKLIAFDSEGNEIFQWGPRPVEAQKIVENAKLNNLPKEKFIEELHLWYGRNRGKAIETEFFELLTDKK